MWRQNLWGPRFQEDLLAVGAIVAGVCFFGFLLITNYFGNWENVYVIAPSGLAAPLISNLAK